MRLNSLFFLILFFCFVINLQAKEVPENPGRPLNTENDDFSPTLAPDGSYMIFASKRGGRRYMDLFITTNKNGTWGKPQPLNHLNSKYNDESPFISKDGKYLFFSSDRDGSKEMKKDSMGRIRVSFDLYYSRLVNKRFTRPRPVAGGVNTVLHEKSPALSHDGQTLYYTTWEFGNVKTARIMKATLRNGRFVEPMMLPSPVNTGHQDAALLPAHDRQGFYFSSARPGGYGGWDLYFVTYTDGKWGKPVNLGYGINSRKNDLYLTRFKESLVLCSNRKGGEGRYDLYIADEPETEKELEFTIVDAETGEKLPGVTTEIQAALGQNRVRIEKESDKKGSFTLKAHPQIEKLGLSIQHEGYLPFKKNLQMKKITENRYELPLKKIEKDASFEMTEITFDYDSARIRAESHPYLNALVDYLQNNPAVKLHIIGHTDLNGEPDYNMQLSRERAASVKSYLVSKGLSSDRFTTSGVGMSEPKINRTGEPYDRRNRRTEFRIR